MNNLSFAPLRPARRKLPAADTLRPDISDADALSQLFNLLPANQWLDEPAREAPRMLFDQFWLEGELCFLFADTNMGKSTLAVQIGDAIARGVPALNKLQFTATACPVLYLDFELDSKQFQQRYSGPGGRYEFAPDFHRAEFNHLNQLPADGPAYNTHMMRAFTRAIEQTGAKVLIIDNLTNMYRNTGTATGALQLMKMLKQFKTRHHLSILVLAHTPKRNESRAITRNDLQGSKMLINFCDSAFAIGANQGGTIARYLKQVKARSAALHYSKYNVLSCNLLHKNNRLQFIPDGKGNELDRLHNPADERRMHTYYQVCRMHNRGRSQRVIAAELKISLATVNKMVMWCTGGREM